MKIESKNAPFKDEAGGPLNDPSVDVYVTENTEWISGTTTLADVVVRHTTTVSVTNGNFDPNPAVIWDPPGIGYFDVWFDVDGNQIFDNNDGILGYEAPAPDDPAVGAGICVAPCLVGGATVPERWVRSLTPWIALAALLGAGAAVGVMRRRRHA
jgi:hypothetical protein